MNIVCASIKSKFTRSGTPFHFADPARDAKWLRD